jgi:hypothetical protein
MVDAFTHVPISNQVDDKQYVIYAYSFTETL